MSFQRTLSVAVGLTAAAINTHAGAQNTTPNPDDDIYVMVTTAIHQHSAETALPVTTLTGDNLHQQARATLGETLSMQPGLSNASFGPAVGQTVIRGQQGRRVMNLINGIPNADASGSSADHAQTVEPLLASSIEVLRGPATLLYGGGAIGGVVNVIDQRIASRLPAKPDFALESRYDSSSDLRSNVIGTNFATGNLAWHLDAVQREWNDLDTAGPPLDERWLARERVAYPTLVTSAANKSGASIANTGGRTTTYTGGLSWIGSSGHLGFAFSHLDNNYGLPPTYFIAPGNPPLLDAETGVSIAMKNDRHDLKGLWLNPASWLDKIDYSLSHVDYAHVELEAGQPGTRFSNNSWQQRLQLSLAPAHGWHSVLGFQHNSDEFAAVGEESFIPESNIDSSGVFLVGDRHVNAWTFELGLRLNRDAYDPQHAAAPARRFTTASSSASVLWDQKGPLSVGLSLAHSARAPSVEELYSNHGVSTITDCVIHHASGACELGSDGFRKERSFDTDLTFTWNLTHLKTTLTLFDNRFHDYIDLLADGRAVAGFPVRLYRQTDAQFRGIELDVEWKPTPAYKVRLYGDTLRAWLDQGGDLPRLPPFHLGVELGYHHNDWSARLSLQHGFGQDRPGQLEQAVASWTRLEAGLDYDFNLGKRGTLTVFVAGHNLLNEEIRLASSWLHSFAPEAGRSIETGIRYRY